MDKEIVSRTIGKCLVESKLKNFDEAKEKFGEYVNISQFDKQPRHVSAVDPMYSTDKPSLLTAHILYGVEIDGTLTWLGQIIDSSD